MQPSTQKPRRQFLKAAAGTGLAVLGSGALAQSFDFKPNQRYPDPSVQIIDPSFAKYRLYSSSVYLRVFSLQLIQLSQHRILSRRAFGLGLRQRGWQGRIKNNALLQRQLTRMCSQWNAPRLATGRCLSSRGIGGFRRSHVGSQGFVPDRFV